MAIDRLRGQRIVSEPELEAVDAYVPAVSYLESIRFPSEDEPEDGSEPAGSHAYASDEGTFYAFARSDVNGDGRPDRIGVLRDTLEVLLHR